jgi:hypothetical protein
MTDHHGINDYNHSCPHEGTFPTMSQFQLGMGTSGTVGLYVTSIMVCLVNATMFAILIRKFLREVPERQVKQIVRIMFH